MKAEIAEGCGSTSITLLPETDAESRLLIRAGMNRSAAPLDFGVFVTVSATSACIEVAHHRQSDCRVLRKFAKK